MTYYSKPRQVVQVPLDKLLFAIAFLYFGLTVTWLFNHSSPQTTNIAQAKTALPAPDKPLLTPEPKKVAAKTAQPSPQSLSVPPAPAVKVSLPPPPPISQPPATPVERIYIPVYPQNPSFTPNKPLKPPKVTAARIMLPPPPVRTAAPSATPATLPLHYGGGKLVGVLELGERSSALVDTNGLTKRVAIGENINGWLVMKVENQQVFLNRGSITKVIDVGQSL